MKRKPPNTIVKMGACGMAMILSCLVAFPQTSKVRINQLGFYPKAAKVAIVESDEEGELPFTIINAYSKDTVFIGKTGGRRHSEFMNGGTHVADFSKLQDTGTYQLICAGAPASAPFNIGNGVYLPLAKGVLKGYYFIRSSVPLTSEYAGPWSRPAGHPDTHVLVHPSAASSTRPAGTVISTPGGWYDAGDYNKYIVNSGITMNTLLSAYEDLEPLLDTLRTHIPESGNALPDILDEVLYNLRWMMTMQDHRDGGVYHKCTYAAFDPMVMPGTTGRVRYVVQKSTAATLDFAAVMAQSARVFSKYEKVCPQLADSCDAAALAAWKWAKEHPQEIYDQGWLNRLFDPDISTGAYGDRRLNDEWFWAASELFIRTGAREYLDSIQNGLADSLQLASWSDTRMLGYFSLVRRGREKLEAHTLNLLQGRLIRYADQLTGQRSDNALDCAMGHSIRDFIWGSNAVAANQAIALLYAWSLSGQKKYLDAAVSNFDYLMGRNATGYDFVTGFGAKRVMHPHHRPSIADGVEAPVPGLLSGGPNPGQQDHCAGYPSREPARSFLDESCSYASNEIAINWNAPMVYLASAMVALQPFIEHD